MKNIVFDITSLLDGFKLQFVMPWFVSLHMTFLTKILSMTRNFCTKFIHFVSRAITSTINSALLGL